MSEPQAPNGAQPAPTPEIDAMAERGDWLGMLGVTVGAIRAARDGRFCVCETPDVTGLSPLCFGCGLENQQQVAKLEAAIRGEPHAYLESSDGDGHCHYCHRAEGDTSHVR